MADNKPTHRLVHVSERISQDRKTVKTIYTEIAPAWPTDKGGISFAIPEGIALTGRCVLVSADKATDAATDADLSGLSDK